MSVNALAELPGGVPAYDLVGPTVDDDVRRVIARYGPDAVKEAIKRQTKARRGRPPEADWRELRDVIEADARDWLDGGDPFRVRSNYSIAKEFADQNPGHSHPATMQRIERKLAKKRVWYTLIVAEHRSWSSYPYAAHIRALETLCEIDPNDTWRMALDRARMNISDYEAKLGHPPSAELTMDNVEHASRGTLANLIRMGITQASRGSPGDSHQD